MATRCSVGFGPGERPGDAMPAGQTHGSWQFSVKCSGPKHQAPTSKHQRRSNPQTPRAMARQTRALNPITSQTALSHASPRHTASRATPRARNAGIPPRRLRGRKGSEMHRRVPNTTSRSFTLAESRFICMEGHYREALFLQGAEGTKFDHNSFTALKNCTGILSCKV